MEIWKLKEKQEVTFGYTGIELVPQQKLSEAQVGYSSDKNGEYCCGISEGDWRREWIVIGRELSCGDPIFIDSNAPDIPVYTAVHGVGGWHPNLISKSYSGFMEILKNFKSVAKGREFPTALESNPMTQTEFDSFLEFARTKGELEDTFFWGLMVADEESGIEPET